MQFKLRPHNIYASCQSEMYHSGPGCMGHNFITYVYIALISSYNIMRENIYTPKCKDFCGYTPKCKDFCGNK